MAFRSVAVDVGISDTVLFECQGASEGSAHSVIFANSGTLARTIDIKLYDHSAGSLTTILPGIVVAKGAPWTIPKPINLNPGDRLSASADGDGVVACVGVYVTTPPSATGFNARGAWSAGATYAKLDLVSYRGSSYVALESVDAAPPPAASWMLVAEGENGQDHPPVPVAYASNLALDFAAGPDFLIDPLTGSIHFGDPLHADPGRRGFVRIQQGAGGGVIPTFSSAWRAVGPLVVGADPNAVTLVNYRVLVAGEILCAAQAVRAAVSTPYGSAFQPPTSNIPIGPTATVTATSSVTANITVLRNLSAKVAGSSKVTITTIP